MALSDIRNLELHNCHPRIDTPNTLADVDVALAVVRFRVNDVTVLNSASDVRNPGVDHPGDDVLEVVDKATKRKAANRLVHVRGKLRKTTAVLVMPDIRGFGFKHAVVVAIPDVVEDRELLGTKSTLRGAELEIRGDDPDLTLGNNYWGVAFFGVEFGGFDVEGEAGFGSAELTEVRREAFEMIDASNLARGLMVAKILEGEVSLPRNERL
jgi:hypothetical protein